MSLSFISNKYRVLGKKGEGTFSEVLKCQNIKDSTFAACKKMKQHYTSIEQVNSLREIQAMRRLAGHPNILELHEVLFDKKSGTLVLICELMDMNIYELIRGRRHYLQDSKIKSYMYQLCKSIYHMHRNGIFHRDVKPENILIKDDVLKLADFGSCRSIYSKQPYTEYISTRWYRAPECLLTDGYYGFKMDMWSVGCVFFEIMSLHPLFPGSNEVDQIAKIHDIMGTPDPNILNKLRNKARGMNFNFPSKKGSGIDKLLPHASADCKELICQMCIYDPDDRITAKQALKHPYFKELREAEKRAILLAKAEQQLQQPQQTPRESKESPAIREPGRDSKRADSEVPDESEKENERQKSDATKSPRPPSSRGPRYPGSILHGRDPTYAYQRREKKKRKQKRASESGPDPVSGSTFFPKVAPKPATFQPTFPSHQPVATSTSLPKLGTSSTTTATYLPQIQQAFVKSKPKPRFGGQYEYRNHFNVRYPGAPTNHRGPTKNIYGHYQLPSIDRRGAGF